MKLKKIIFWLITFPLLSFSFLWFLGSVVQLIYGTFIYKDFYGYLCHLRHETVLQSTVFYGKKPWWAFLDSRIDPLLFWFIGLGISISLFYACIWAIRKFKRFENKESDPNIKSSS